MHVIAALILFGHGLSHLVGFLTGWNLMPEKLPPITKLFWGQVSAGPITSKVLGVLWLLLTVGFCVAALACLLRAGFWPRFTQVVALMSLILCVVEAPDSQIGLVVNLAILGALSFALHAGWQLTG
jgi:hypothetical protein